MTVRRASSVLAVALLAPVLVAPPASAGPGEVIPLVCGSTTYQVRLNGNGDWTPARDVASTRVFIPNAFGPFTGTVRDASGAIVDAFTEPASAKGSGKHRNDVTCTYSITQTSDGSDPEFPAGFTFSGSGTVSGRVVAG